MGHVVGAARVSQQPGRQGGDARREPLDEAIKGGRLAPRQGAANSRSSSASAESAVTVAACLVSVRFIDRKFRRSACENLTKPAEKWAAQRHVRKNRALSEKVLANA